MIKKILITLLLISLSTRLFCHDFSWMTWRNLYLSSNFDNQSNKSYGFEYNRTLLILNYSLIYQNWYNNKTLSKNNEITCYIGLGLINYLQIQYGYSNLKDPKLRFKSSLMIKDFIKDRYIDQYKDWWEQISFCIFFERRFSKTKLYNYGFEIGYSFNPSWGPIFKNHMGPY